MNDPLDYIAINRALWDKKTEYHTGSDFYKNNEFINGASSLNEIELQLLGDISGKSILHLQCHFGQDTLSLARMGAKATGVDLSGAAIKQARELNTLLKLDAEFIESDIYSLPDVLNQQFDIVFTSYGTIGWLPDVDKWASIIATSLKPQGRFIFADFHPVIWMYDDEIATLKYSYFNKGVIEETEAGTYADTDADINLKSLSWNHSIAEVLQALINTGLSITTFREYDYSPYACFKNTVEVEKGKFQIIGKEGIIPMVYALEAIKS